MSCSRQVGLAHKIEFFRGHRVAAEGSGDGFPWIDAILLAGLDIGHGGGMLAGGLHRVELATDIHVGLFIAEAPLGGVVGDGDVEVLHPGKISLPVDRVGQAPQDAELCLPFFGRKDTAGGVSQFALPLLMLPDLAFSQAAL